MGHLAGALLALLFCALLLAACGGDGAELESSPAPERADQLAIAIDGRAGRDPLLADQRPSQFVLRQVFEPPVGPIEPPFGRAGRRKGLIVGFRPNGDDTVWTGRLRRAVRFADGASFNASAVAVNARRWAQEAPGLVPGLAAADAPRTDRVRLILSEPVPDLPDHLDDSRLGIVSPDAFDVRPNGRIEFDPAAAAGTGPFVIEGRTPSAITLARNPGWWGTGFGLGPAMSRVAFTIEDDAAERLAALETGQVQIADELGESSLKALASDPLADAVRAPGVRMGVERSVRGVATGLPGTPLSGVWLTSVGQEVQIG